VLGGTTHGVVACSILKLCALGFGQFVATSRPVRAIATALVTVLTEALAFAVVEVLISAWCAVLC
jgi:hypothetical protein